MKLALTSLLQPAITLCLTSAQTTKAATLVPLTATGFNHDIVFENDGSRSVTTSFGARHFVESTIPEFPSYVGLSPSREYTTTVGADTITFKLQPYDAMNVALVKGSSGTVTLTLPTPVSMDRIAFAHSAGNGASGSFTATVHYADASTQVLSIGILDWISTGNISSVPIFDVARDDGDDPVLSGIETSFRPIWSVFASSYAIEPSKTVTAVTFTLSGGGSSQDTGIFAISGSIPEPSTLLLTLLSTAALLRRTRPPATPDQIPQPSSLPLLTAH